MNLSEKHGFVFLCMPKCASTSIEGTLGSYCSLNYKATAKQKHIGLADFKKTFPQYSQLETICIFREPTDWVGSWYRYRRRSQNKGRPTWTGDITFDQFIEGYLSEDLPRFANWNLPTQSDFVVNSSNDVGVDLIFDMNRIDLIAEYLSDKFKTKITFPSKNTSPKMELELSSHLVDPLMSKLERDLKIYDIISTTGLARAEQINSNL